MHDDDVVERSLFERLATEIASGTTSETEAVQSLVDALTDDELLGLLDGDAKLGALILEFGRTHYNNTPVVAGEVARLGIPGIRFSDGPRGVVMGQSTAFPVALARGASWDLQLEERVASAIGQEARAQGANLFAGICINMPPFPGWGRTQESYGEDPVLLGEFGAAAVRGTRPWVMSCVKHFALNSMEESRFIVDVHCDADVLHEVYLPHFRRVVEEGVDSVMSAYNAVNGEWAGQSAALLGDVLRDSWGFDGFVMTDFVWGLRDPIKSVAAGQDLEMPARQQRARVLSRALADGRLDRSDAERAAARILLPQLRFTLRALPAPDRTVVASAEHRELAREVARRGAVLIRNEHVAGAAALPLPSGAGRVAVVGQLADAANEGDRGSSKVFPPESSTILAGLRERLGDRVVAVTPNQPADAVTDAVREADAAVVVVGLTADDEGEAMVAVDPETFAVFGGIFRLRLVALALQKAMAFSRRFARFGGDRRELRLSPTDVELIRTVAAANERTIVVLIGGSTIVLSEWVDDVPAVLIGWYPGMEGGRAIADILTGDAEPTGRLPLAIPTASDDLPAVDWLSRRVDYPRRWGQRKLDVDGVDAAFPFGFGLGYTEFEIAGAEVSPIDGETFRATVTVRNSGRRDGRHVIQVYGLEMHGQRSVRHLLGFASTHAAVGESVSVDVSCTTRPLQRWVDGGFVGPSRPIAVEVGSYSGDPRALTRRVEPGAFTA